ncbi:MAG: DUF1573 domain-containing protein [Chitinophagaceae bacterium]|nr:DUF1573 domain-containing protein [Chitinophagaceae bacterium]
MMKKVYLFTISVLLMLAAAAQKTAKAVPAGSGDVLLLKETKYDFGKIPQGKPVKHIFEVVNTTKEPLQIENVQASCGCTTPEWDHTPIAPNATKQITVGYNAAMGGPFEKTITVFYDSGKTKQFIIKGEVWQTPAEAAPANASVQLLKNIN